MFPRGASAKRVDFDRKGIVDGMTAEFEMKKDESVIIVNATKKRTTSDGCADNKEVMAAAALMSGNIKLLQMLS